MSQFEEAAKITMAIEGGYSNSPNDLGGETNLGISKRSFPDVDIKNLTPQSALVIYKSKFWDQYRLGEIKQQVIANYIFDMFFNMAYEDCALAIQKTVRQFMPIDTDGVFGSMTIKAINAIADIDKFLNMLKLKRLAAYLAIVEKRPSQRPNLQSWLKRSL